MESFKKVYLRNKQLDDIFFSKYTNETKMFEKNCIEFLVELSEFINETKCFKYLSIKKPQHHLVLEELADTFTMLMYFYNISNIDIDTFQITNFDEDLLQIINETYYLGTKLYNELSKELLDKIFVNLLKISKLLNIEEKEIIEAIKQKHSIIEKRLKDDNY